MTLQQLLAGQARQILGGLEVENRNRADRIRELQAEVRKLDAADTDAVHAILRGNQFDARDARCPRCWIIDGKRVDMAPQPSETDNDLLRCRECGNEIEISA